jgi:hypothetical protein
MSRIVLIFTVLICFSVQAQEPTEEGRLDFIIEFTEAVNDHKSRKVIKMMNKAYRKDQIQFLDGNKEQFVNELFSGYKNDQFYNTKFDHIYECLFSEIVENNDGTATCYFILTEQVNNNERAEEIYIDLLLVFEKGKWGFVGASG